MHSKLLFTGIGSILISLLLYFFRENYVELKRSVSGSNFDEQLSRTVISLLIMGFFVLGVLFVTFAVL